MTTGEYLVAHSSLPTGTAMAHWLSVQSGEYQIVYCSQISAVIEQNEIVVTSKPKRSAPAPQPIVQPSRQPPTTKQQNSISVFSTKPSITVLNEPDEITVTQRATTVTVKQDLAQETVARKPKRAVIN